MGSCERFCQGWPGPGTMILHISISAIAGMTEMHNCTQLLVQEGVLRTLCLTWPQPQFSQSQPPSFRIIGEAIETWLKFYWCIHKAKT
jgi:hypothetical protein